MSWTETKKKARNRVVFNVLSTAYIRYMYVFRGMKGKEKGRRQRKQFLHKGKSVSRPACTLVLEHSNVIASWQNLLSFMCDFNQLYDYKLQLGEGPKPKQTVPSF